MLKNTLGEFQQEGFEFDIEMKVNGDIHPDFLCLKL
ncbi:MAG: hypothetical protein DGJ47_000637 [Rickettsiaceae bacterium]